MFNIPPEELETVKERLNEAQKNSHFVIFETYDPTSKEHLHMITDYNSYNKIKKERNSNTPMRIVRDIVPVTDNLALWAIAENKASEAAGNSENMKEILKIINDYINDVLVDNKLPKNK